MAFAFLQTDVDASCQRELALLREGLTPLGFTLQGLTRKQMQSSSIALPSDALVAGEMEVVLSAMKALRIPIPPPNDYPPSLQGLLHRKVWFGTIQDLQTHVDQDGASPIFAKPAGDRKLFRGRVFRSVHQLEALSKMPSNTPLAFAEPIPIISEWRFYVMDSQIICCENYDGDPRDAVDKNVVLQAIDRLNTAGESFKAYAIDFGLLRDGRTVLIEMNDGFCVGTFCEISPDDYARFTVARWNELLGQRQPASL